MNIAKSKLTAQGQVLVPVQVRRRLGLGPGSLVEWVDEGGVIQLRRAGRHSSEDIHRALFAVPPKKKAAAEMKQGVRERMRGKQGS